MKYKESNLMKYQGRKVMKIKTAVFWFLYIKIKIKMRYLESL